MKKNAILVFSLLFILILNSTVFAGSNLIIPGKSIGDFNIGAINLSSIENQFGKPDRKGRTCLGIIIQYKKLGLRFYFNPSSMILERIRTINRKYQTSSGIKVGSTINDVMKLYNCKPYENKGIYDCEDLGIIFYYDSKTAKITSIAVNKL
jgi:hypothetical protein